VFAIGDTHGNLNKLNKLLAQLRLTREDELIFLGDYLDRGPDSWGVLQRVYRLAMEYPGVVCLKGNHEAMFFDRLEWIPDLEHLLAADNTEYYKGDTGIKELQQAASTAPELVEEILHWLVALPVHYESHGTHFSHAGCDLSRTLEDQTDSDFLWVREAFFEKYSGKALWVIGHTPVQNVVGKEIPPYPLRRDNNVVMLDTGSFIRGGKLSCLEVLSGDIFQA